MQGTININKKGLTQYILSVIDQFSEWNLSFGTPFILFFSQLILSNDQIRTSFQMFKFSLISNMFVLPWTMLNEFLQEFSCTILTKMESTAYIMIL